jgi:catechol 2,3-dioxygenase-like lactoylglutathione lyase family enzyme
MRPTLPSATHTGTNTSSLDHLTVVVSDVERAVAWHEAVLGATRAGDGRTSIGGASFRLIEATAGTRGPAPAADRVGSCHVCIAVPDVHAAYARLLAYDVPASTEPLELIPGIWSVYFHDPDGIRYQFVQRAGPSGLHHFAYGVADLDATLEWYAQRFGSAPTYRNDASGELVSRTLEVEDGAYRVALVPLGDVHLELMEWRSAAAAGPPLGAGEVGTWQLGVRSADAPGELADPDGMRLLLL